MLLVQRQSRVLSALLVTPEAFLPPSILLYGQPSTGRRTALNAALALFPGYTVSVDCVECYTPALLFQLVWRLVERVLPASAGIREQAAVSSVDVLLKRLQESAAALSRGLVLVFERAERLRSVSSHSAGATAPLLATLLKLQQLSGLNLCTVLVSSVVWHKLGTTSCCPRPVQLHFPQFSRSELCQLLMQWPPHNADHRLYADYLRALVFTLYVSCRSVTELRHMATSNWHHYTRPLRDRQLTSTNNPAALWKHVEPYLRSASRHIFLRQTDTSDSVNVDTEQKSLTASILSDLGRLNAELPFYSKFLLIAAFLASFNPAKTDRRFFVRARCKQRRVRASARGMDKAGISRDVALIGGPHSFPLHRLMAIFYFIVEDRVTPTTHLYTQLMSLVGLRLLTRASSPDNIDTCKFRCLVGLHTTRAIAASVDFQLDRYLYDFV